jgi:hypothetical protein
VVKTLALSRAAALAEAVEEEPGRALLRQIEAQGAIAKLPGLSGIGNPPKKNPAGGDTAGFCSALSGATNESALHGKGALE